MRPGPSSPIHSTTVECLVIIAAFERKLLYPKGIDKNINLHGHCAVFSPALRIVTERGEIILIDEENKLRSNLQFEVSVITKRDTFHIFWHNFVRCFQHIGISLLPRGLQCDIIVLYITVTVYCSI